MQCRPLQTFSRQAARAKWRALSATALFKHPSRTPPFPFDCPFDCRCAPGYARFTASNPNPAFLRILRTLHCTQVMIAEGKGGGVNRLAKEPHSYGHPPRQPETLQSAGSLRKPYRVLVVKRGRRWPPTLCGNCDTACKGGDHRTSEYDNVGAHKHACTLLDLLSSVPMLTLCARFAFCHELSRIAASMQAGGIQKRQRTTLASLSVHARGSPHSISRSESTSSMDGSSIGSSSASSSAGSDTSVRRRPSVVVAKQSSFASADGGAWF